MAETETLAFQAEVNHLLSHIMNTFYGDKKKFRCEFIGFFEADCTEREKMTESEIYHIKLATKDMPRGFIDAEDRTSRFFEEMIRKANCDLLERRYESGTDTEQLELIIKVVIDNSNNSLSFITNGVGMTKADMVEELGAITGYATKEFIKALVDGDEANWNEYHGFGIYTARVVATKITVTSKHNNDEQHVWEYEGGTAFTIIGDTNGESLGRGTKTTLFLREDQLQYLEEHRLQDLIRECSAICSFPISLQVES